MAFAPDGKAWISYIDDDTTDILRIAELKKGGEIWVDNKLIQKNGKFKIKL